MLESCSLHVSGATPTDDLAWLWVSRYSLAVGESGGGVVAEVVDTWNMARAVRRNSN